MSLDELKMYYASKKIVADGGALTIYLADSGTLNTLVDAALTEANDFWNGGLILFMGDTPTVALRGITAHIKDFDAASDTLTFAKNLPAIPAAGEKYKLIAGGSYRSNTQVLGLLAGGVFPELQNVALTNVTGVTLKFMSAGLRAYADVDINYTDATTELDLEGGTAYVVAGDANDVVLEDPTNEGYAIVDIVQASLPGSDQTDNFTLSRQNQTYVPDVEGYESRNSLKGKTRYRLAVVKNESVAVMNTLEAAAEPEAATSTTVSTSSGLGANEFDVADGSSFPAGGFWLKNTTLDDFRYVISRSGNTMKVAATNAWTKITIDANNTVEPLPGQTLDAPGGDGIIDAIKLNSGSWAGGDANATIYLKGVTGVFLDTEQMKISAVNIGIQSGAEAKGLRDKTGQTWVSTNAVKLASPIDIAAEAPTANQFANPAEETLYPDGALTFADKDDISTNALTLTNLAASGIYGVWQREWIMDNSASATDVKADLAFSWS